MDGKYNRYEAKYYFKWKNVIEIRELTSGTVNLQIFKNIYLVFGI